MDELDETVVAVRADTAAFARDVAMMRGVLVEEIGRGADHAQRLLEAALHCRRRRPRQ